MPRGFASSRIMVTRHQYKKSEIIYEDEMKQQKGNGSRHWRKFEGDIWAVIISYRKSHVAYARVSDLKCVLDPRVA